MPNRSAATHTSKTPAPKWRATALPAPFTKGQEAVLQLLNRPLTDGQLADIQNLIGQYLANQTDALAQQVWIEKGYTQADMDALLTTHIRTPYNKK